MRNYFLKLLSLCGACLLAGVAIVGTAVVAQAKADFVRPGENIALGKRYSWSAAPSYKHCTDPGDNRQLTDGVYSSGLFWTQKTTVGWKGGKPVTITVDLGKVEPIRGASFNTAAGVAGVIWPMQIAVLVSDDGKNFYDSAELTTANAPPPSSGYAVHRFWTDQLRTHGRYVMFVVSSDSYVFADEIEIYRGESAWLGTPFTGAAVTNGVTFANTQRVWQSVARRLQADAQAVRQLASTNNLPADARKNVKSALTEAEAQIPGLPRHYDDNFRAVLPLNRAEQDIFRAQAAVWRAMGAAPLTAWKSGTWDPLMLVHVIPRSATEVNVRMMRNEFRAGAFNLSNASDEEKMVKLQIVDLPGGTNPSWITVHEVLWTDTRSGEPVAAALPEAQRTNGDFMIHVPSGLTRQVWLTFHPTNVEPGEHKGRIVISGGSNTLEVPLTVQVSPLRFPDHVTLHLGGWDYTDTDSRFDITPQNRDLIIRHLKEHFVDSPWATAAVLPFGKFDGKNEFSEKPDTKNFDTWLQRWPDSTRYCVFLNVNKKSAGVDMGTPAFEQRVAAWIRFWAQHLREHGLKPEQLALLLVDEPLAAEQDATILGWAKAIHAAATGVEIWEDPVHSDPFAANQEMLAECDVLCPNRVKFLQNEKTHSYFSEHRPARAELAFYSCANPMRLLDPYSYIRLQAWSAWQLGACSSYFWAFCDSGLGSSWNEYATSRAPYTPYFLDKTSLTPGKHMEAIRESAEDYEYLVMLRNSVTEARKKNVDAAKLDRATKLLADAASRVLDAKNASDLTWKSEKDRNVADAVRGEILEQLETLSR